MQNHSFSLDAFRPRNQKRRAESAPTGPESVKKHFTEASEAEPSAKTHSASHTLVSSPIFSFNGSSTASMQPPLSMEKPSSPIRRAPSSPSQDCATSLSSGSSSSRDLSCSSEPVEKEDAGITFWNKRYQHATNASDGKRFFEWYSNWSQMAPVVVPHLKKNGTVLDIGCGNSKVPFYLANLPMNLSVIAIDRNLHVIQSMNNLPKMKNLRHVENDALKLSGIRDKSIDTVMDKGLLDCMLTLDGPEYVQRMLKQVERVLSDKGSYLVMSHAHPSHRIHLFNTSTWSVSVRRIMYSPVTLVTRCLKKYASKLNIEVSAIPPRHVQKCVDYVTESMKKPSLDGSSHMFAYLYILEKKCKRASSPTSSMLSPPFLAPPQ